MSILVLGATGAQGGAVARRLLKYYTIRTITRDPDSPAARELSSLGANVIRGDLEDVRCLQEAMGGCSGLFLNLPQVFGNPMIEVQQTKRIIDLAKAAGIKQVVYSGALAADKPEQLDFWDPNGLLAGVFLPKQAIENEIRNSDFDVWTILRPGHFMANYLNPRVAMYAGLTETGILRTAYSPDTLLPLVDHDDIGKFASAAFLDQGRFHQQEIEIASQLLTVDDLILCLRDATGKDIQAVYLSDEDLEKSKMTDPLLAAQLTLRGLAKFVNIETVKLWGLPLASFLEFLQREKLAVTETYSQLS